MASGNNTEKVVIACNAVVAKLHNPSRDVKMAVQSILSYEVAGAEHSDAFKSRHWDGRSSFLEFKEGLFPAGFVPFVAASLRQRGMEVSIARKPAPEPLGPEAPVIDAFGNDDPRYSYQLDVVRRLRKHQQIIAQIATGGGKSRIARMVYASINRPTLFLTTRGILMYQMRDAFERDMGVPVSVLGDDQFGHTIVENGLKRTAIRKMSVGMVQTLAARLRPQTVEGELERMIDSLIKRELKELKDLRQKLEKTEPPTPEHEIQHHLDQVEKAQAARRPSPDAMKLKARAKVDQHMQERTQTIALLKKFELIILEEAHEAAGDSFYEVMRHCTNAFYRLALTATPFMKDSEEDNMRLHACSGPIGIKVSELQLIDSGILAQPYFEIVKFPRRPLKLYRSTPFASAYRIGIVENPERNKAIVDRCLRFARYGQTSMVLVQHTKHGDILRGMLTEAGLRVEFIKGEDDQEGRKAALRRLAAGEIDALIGTNILDVGVDVPAVGHVCLAGGGKAQVALRQRIGRGLRAKKFGPNIAFVTDFDDEYNEHLKMHSATRLAIIKGTPGFDRFINIGGEFNLDALGLTIARAA